MAEDPKEALLNGFSIHSKVYLENKLRKPLESVSTKLENNFPTFKGIRVRFLLYAVPDIRTLHPIP